MGFAQTATGFFAVLSALLLLYDAFDLQMLLGFSAGEETLFFWFFTVYGLLSIVSGLFLLFEPNVGR